MVLLARRKTARAGLGGLVAGFGFPPLYVAFLNRYGPGQLCYFPGFLRTTTTCIQLLNPWPWAGAGLLCIVVGVVLFLVWSRRGRLAASRPKKLPG